MSTDKSPEPVVLQCLGLLLASIVLGICYNQLSPLGVRGNAPAVNPTSPADHATSPAPDGRNYENVTMRLQVQPLPGAQPRIDAPVLQPPSSPGIPSHGSPVLSGLDLKSSAGRPGTNFATAPASNNPHHEPVVHKFPTLSWPETKAEVEAGKAVLIDSRLPKYFEADHIPGAVPLQAAAGEDELAAFAAKYPSTTPLILYCYSANCSVADHLGERLVRLHRFTNLRILAGGYEEYRIANSIPHKAVPQ